MRFFRLSVSLLCGAALLFAACARHDNGRLARTTVPTYDKTTGRLTQLTYDRDKDGIIDTWTDMDGSRPLRSRVDTDGDGRIDRWEYYDAKGAIAKVGFSRKKDGKEDAWAFSGADGRLQRIEISSTGDPKKIDRWEYYDASGLARAQDDTNGDGKPDKWETYTAGGLATASFDENGDGRPDRRLTYSGGRLVLIESAPDASGGFTKRVAVK